MGESGVLIAQLPQRCSATVSVCSRAGPLYCACAAYNAGVWIGPNGKLLMQADAGLRYNEDTTLNLQAGARCRVRFLDTERAKYSHRGSLPP